MEKKLLKIFNSTRKAHFGSELNMQYSEYYEKFKIILNQELIEVPKIDFTDSNLGMYLELSILVLSLIRIFEQCGLNEEDIGEIIYRTALSYFKLPLLSRFIKSKLFYSKINIKAIKRRELKTQESENGVNGFKLRLLPIEHKDKFTVIYEECGICKYYKSRGMEKYIKYCCLVDYCIMENLGIYFNKFSKL